jgi:rare lipoprotein A
MLTECVMIATIYAGFFEGRTTANGEIFRHSEMTAAHRTLPMGTRLVVSRGHRTIVVRINDRCPKRGVLDLTRTAAASLALPGMGKVKVRRLQ